jgi:hypothetical protein
VYRDPSTLPSRFVGLAPASTTTTTEVLDARVYFDRVEVRIDAALPVGAAAAEVADHIQAVLDSLAHRLTRDAHVVDRNTQPQYRVVASIAVQVAGWPAVPAVTTPPYRPLGVDVDVRGPVDAGDVYRAWINAQRDHWRPVWLTHPSTRARLLPAVADLVEGTLVTDPTVPVGFLRLAAELTAAL